MIELLGPLINTPNAYEKCRPWHAHPGFGSGLLGDNGLGAFAALLMREIGQVNDDEKGKAEGEEVERGEAVALVEEWVDGPGGGRLEKVVVVVEESEEESEESGEEGGEEGEEEKGGWHEDKDEEAELLFEVFSLYYWNGYLVTLLAEGWSSEDAAVLVRGLYPDISTAQRGRGQAGACRLKCL